MLQAWPLILPEWSTLDTPQMFDYLPRRGTFSDKDKKV
jgi:hypothetical protein